jgi:hypothetical protein
VETEQAAVGIAIEEFLAGVDFSAFLSLRPRRLSPDR